MTRRVGVIVALLALVASASAHSGHDKDAAKQADGAEAEAPPDVAPPAPDDEDYVPSPEEIEASLPPHVNGPKVVGVGSNIEVELPAGMFLIHREHAQKLLEESGSSGQNVHAAIGKVGASWFVIIEYDDVGYVSDTDADELDPNDLFKQYEEGNRLQNERRRSLGVPELFIDGWSEMPTYDKAKHHLVWGLKGHDSDGQVINYFTRILGRHGFMSFNLIDAPDSLEASKLEVAPLLAGTHFTAGSTYADHQEGDRSSGMGLRALVLGGTGVAVMKAAKTGFLIKLLLVLKKGFVVILLAIGGLLKWLFGRKKEDAVASDDAPLATEVGAGPESDDGASPPTAG